MNISSVRIYNHNLHYACILVTDFLILLIHSLRLNYLSFSLDGSLVHFVLTLPIFCLSSSVSPAQFSIYNSRNTIPKINVIYRIKSKLAIFNSQPLLHVGVHLTCKCWLLLYLRKMQTAKQVPSEVN
jgi:hypothetical protein